jgi:hypothetical protein
MNMGQTRVAAIGRKIGFYCYIFGENFQEIWGFGGRRHNFHYSDYPW